MGAAVSGQMSALRWHAAGDLRLEQVPVPAVPDGCSLVQVHLCGICGTDLSEYRNGPKMIWSKPHPLSGQAPPVTLGHEFAGVVVDTGAHGPFPAGTRVTADACWRCNRCSDCLAGDYHLCRYGGSIGLHSDGAFAPFAAIPDYCLVPLPAGVPDEAAALTEPLAVALHGLERGQVSAGDDVVVLGFGPIGASGALIARALGARVHVVELARRRAAAARRIGFPLIEAGEGLPRRVRAALGSGGADVVLETTGVSAVVPEAIDSVRRGGRVVQLGMGGVPATVGIERLVLFERALIGSLGYRHHLPKVVRMMDEGVLDPTAIVTATVALGEAAAMIEEMASDPSAHIKVLVDTRG
jgi:(R,R)-butanediol dehydrogenase/meso-butanediol dehydrogenase/diacetyl reductase